MWQLAQFDGQDRTDSVCGHVIQIKCTANDNVHVTDQWEDLAAEETVKEEEHDILEDEFLHPIVVLEEGIPPKQEESDLTHKIIIKTNQSQSKHSDEPQRYQLMYFGKLIPLYYTLGYDAFPQTFFLLY